MIKKLGILIAVLLVLNTLLPVGLTDVLAEDEQLEEVTEPVDEEVESDEVAESEEEAFEPVEMETLVYDFEDGTTQDWGPRGDVDVEAVTEEAYEGEYSLKTTGREDTWQGPALNALNILEKDVSYEISCYVKLAEEPDETREVKISMEYDVVGEDTNWATIGEVNISDTEWTKISGNYQFNDEMDSLTLYIESSDPEEVFYIDNFEIQMPLDESGLSTDFEDGTEQGWRARIGSENIEVTDEDSYSGEYSLFVTDREETYEGPTIYALDRMERGGNHNISVWIKLASSEEPAEVALSVQVQEDGEEDYITVASGEVTADEWTLLQGDYLLGYAVESLDVYVETWGDSLASFYIDDFSLEPPKGGIQLDIPSVYDVYEEYFTIGTAVEPAHLEGDIGGLVEKHFNSIVAENRMKPEYTAPSEGEYYWEEADIIADYAREHDMELRYHTLVWHSQMAEWFFLDEEGNPMVDETDPEKREANKELLLQRMEDYIREVVRRYGDVVKDWDVVNEVIEPGEPNGMRKSDWYLIAGTDFIKEAFRITRDELDQNGWTDARLYINDYNTHNATKRDFLYDLVVEMLEEDVPIDGVGHQTHVNIEQPSLSLIMESIYKFADLGLDNQVTELDVSVYNDDSLSYDEIPEDVLVIQGHRYKQLFDAFRENADIISNVTIWGVYDGQSWLNYFFQERDDAPLLFDRDLQAKHAYWGIVDPDNLPTLLQNMSTSRGTPEINGETELLWDVINYTSIGSSDEFKGSIKTLWDEDNLYLFIEVIDESFNEDDMVEIFIGEDEKVVFNRSGEASEDVEFVLDEIDGGYMIEAAVPIDGLDIGDQILFDVRYTDAETGAVLSWNDVSHGQDESREDLGTISLVEEVRVTDAVYGTPVINAEMDEIWEDANVISTDRFVIGTEGSTAELRTMWDEDKLYIYSEVTDSLLSKESSDAYQEDSVEIFIDQYNDKTETYGPDDAQYRVNFDNEVSFGENASEEYIESATAITDYGYIVELAIDLHLIEPEVGQSIGFDFQVNNDEDGDGSRDTVSIWNDTSGNSYMDPSGLGVLTFADRQEEEPEPVVETQVELKGSSITTLDEGEYTVSCKLKAAEDAYAEDIILDFDEEVFEFVKAEPATDGIEIIDVITEEEGEVRVIVINEGGISGDIDLIDFTFEPKAIEADAYVDFSVSVEVGKAPSGEVENLHDVLESVRVAVTDPADVNKDGVINTGDLAIVVYHYGKDTDSSDWEEAKIADVNNDGVIDILDISYVASRIVEE
ncbi:endo-1,4-beta-xylanase [Herbivorax sp. ANBcel31]|uniref:endo-1,4-beta-xylanase n=1 Tax=Herbivorax sp. ANBcel31 TaxID=3069754 RepID=UPI0027ADAA1E|nr:endo-1,4-beta-xylanase [Herbivorax sp. ANBcel31]MDQ2087714.1 endo-1,4-beta-xylanase [Herbivorax sp. ANBcel31]